MQKFPKVLLLIPLIWGLFFLAAGILAYRALIAPGMLWVDIEDHREGVHMALPVPAAILNAAIDVADVARVRIEVDEIEREFAEVAPLIAVAMEELEKYPDVMLVSIEGPGEHVRIGKSNGVLKVDVSDEDAHVRVSIPAKTLKKISHLVEL